MRPQGADGGGGEGGGTEGGISAFSAQDPSKKSTEHKMALEPDKVFSTYDFGKFKEEIYFDEEEAIAQLIRENLIFVNYTTGLYVNCSDVFAWALAEGEHINDDKDLEDLYKHVMEDDRFGSIIWCCKRRGEKPQAPVAKRMKECNSWPAILDTLKNNRYDEYLAQTHANTTT